MIMFSFCSAIFLYYWLFTNLLKPANLLQPFTSIGSIDCKANILILSTVKSIQMRHNIRKTWLSDMKRSYRKFKYYFVVGHDMNVTETFHDTYEYLKDEINEYNDLLVLPFIDSYWNLSVKVSLLYKRPELLDEAMRCTFIFKIDEDVVIRANRLISLIHSLPSNYPIYGGHIYDNVTRFQQVIRDPNNKFSFTYEEFPHKYFQPYAVGPIYFMSTTVAERLPYHIIRIPFTSSNNPKGSNLLSNANTTTFLRYNYHKLSSYRHDILSIINEEHLPSTYYMNPRPAIFRLEDVFIGSMIGNLTNPNVKFWHVKKFILESNHPRARDQLALHDRADFSHKLIK